MHDRRKKVQHRGGCGFLIATSIATCIFLVLNGMLVTRFYGWWSPFAPEQFKRPNVAQALGLTLPVVMLFFEWWAFDFITGLLPRRSTRSEQAHGWEKRSR